VDGPGHQFLARSALSQQEHVGRRIGDLADQGVDLLHLLAAAHHGAEIAGIISLLRNRGSFLPLRLSLFQGVAHDCQEVVDIKVLLDVVVGPLAHRGQGRLPGSEGGQEDDSRLRRRLLHAPEQLDPVHARHLQIRDDEVEFLLPDDLQRRGPVVCRGDLVPRTGEHDVEHVLHAPVVVDNENPFHGHLLLSCGPRRSVPVRMLGSARTV